MDLKSNHNSPVLTDSSQMNSSGLGIHSNSFSPLGAVFPHGLFLNVPRKKPAALDWSKSWLDAMKSSSPTHRKIGMLSRDNDVSYTNWKLKYPSAIGCFEQITNQAKGKIIAIFLDYDGTLSPIVDNPDCAFMSSSMRSTVRNLAKLFPTAIISGRSRDKVYEFVGLPELYYAASHGMDIKAPLQSSSSRLQPPECRSCIKQATEASLYQPASEFLPMIDEVLRSLVEITTEIEGSKVENNKFCVSVHYRNVDEKNWAEVAQRVQEVLEEYPRLRLTHGRKVLEIRPVLDWDKGKAVEFLLETLGLNNRDDVLPIYIGDDRTDEDAFKVLRAGKRGYGILVSSVAKESNAAYSLRDPSEVMEFLKSLAAWKKLSPL